MVKENIQFIPNQFITNFSIFELDFYEKAVKEWKKQGGEGTIYFKNVAYDRDGNIVPDCKAMYFKGNILKEKTLSFFWKIFNSLEKNA